MSQLREREVHADRHRGEHTRMEGENALRHAVEQAGHAVMLADTDGTIEYVNPAFERITGYTAEEAVGQTPRLLNSGEHDKEFFADLWTTILSGEVWDSEIVNSRKDGSLMYVDHTIAPVTDEEGNIRKFVAMFRDVTERKLERQQLEVLYRVFRHNLRNELNVIAGYAESIAEETTDDRIADRARAIAESGETLTDVYTTAKRTRSIVRNVADATCISTVTELCNLVETANERHPDAEVSLKASTGATWVKSPVLVATEELIENAIAHNDRPEPTVTIVVDTCERKDANPFGPDSWYTIEVRDDGPGIPQQEQTTLQEGNETPLQHSNGQGLWMVHWIVRHVGGKIDIAENDPRGTVVSVSVPRCPSGQCTPGESDCVAHENRASRNGQL